MMRLWFFFEESIPILLSPSILIVCTGPPYIPCWVGRANCAACPDAAVCRTRPPPTVVGCRDRCPDGLSTNTATIPPGPLCSVPGLSTGHPAWRPARPATRQCCRTGRGPRISETNGTHLEWIPVEKRGNHLTNIMKLTQESGVKPKKLLSESTLF